MQASDASDGDATASPVILGANNLIARYLVERLAAEGRGALLVARRPIEVPPSCEFQRVDLLGPGAWTVPRGRTIVSLLPLPILAGTLDRLDTAAAIVAVGSTSLFGKAASPDPYDRDSAADLGAAEETLRRWSAGHGIALTILRPTMVYDGVGDRNIARIARLIRAYGVFFIARPATGLRQPIHVDDVAKAILASIGNPAAADRAFNIAGGEILTYRAMVERVFVAQGRKPRLVSLPIGLIDLGLRLASTCGLRQVDGMRTSVFQRMNEDLVFDVAAGLEVLAYAPRRFEP